MAARGRLAGQRPSGGAEAVAGRLKNIAVQYRNEAVMKSTDAVHCVLGLRGKQDDVNKSCTVQYRRERERERKFEMDNTIR